MSSPARRKPRPAPTAQQRLAWVFVPPSTDDLIRLLSAWRLWILGGLIAAALGAAAYAVAPPAHRARATVNVDFHLEQAWPQNSDREQFYYLERETRKLMEIAFSDAVMETVAREVRGVTLEQLRTGAAQLSQPGNGGWHFFGIDPDAGRAAMIASTWATAFTTEVRQQILDGEAGGLEQFITVDMVQAGSIHPERSVGIGTYMLASVIVVLAFSALGMLLIHPRK